MWYVERPCVTWGWSILWSLGLLWDLEELMENWRGPGPKWVDLESSPYSVDAGVIPLKFESFSSSGFWKSHEDLRSVISVGMCHSIVLDVLLCILSYVILSYFQQGIFPKSFIHIKEVTIEKRRYLPFFTRLGLQWLMGCLCPIFFESMTWRMWSIFFVPVFICVAPFPHLIQIDSCSSLILSGYQ